MNQRITRRRFGQLVIAGSAGAGLVYFANKTLAQQTPLVVFGISSGRITTTSNTANPMANNSTGSSNIAPTATASNSLSLILQSLDVTTGQIKTVNTFDFLADGRTPILQSNEELSAFTALANGSLVVAITPATGSKNETNSARLTVLGASPTSVPLSGLNQGEKLDSFVGTNDGGLIGLVLQKSSKPPVRLVNINLQTGAITANNTVSLPADQRFTTLVHCPADGKLYTLTTAQDGNTSLVQLDQAQHQPIIVLKQLTFNGKIWNSGLESLVCSGSGQFLALGALRYVTPNSVYSVDAGNGTLTALTQFNVSKATIGLTTANLG